MLAVAFTDELATGVVPSAAPELLGDFSLTPAAAAGWTLVAFQVLAVVVEPPLLALAHGRRERPLRVLGLALMALTAVAAALAPSYELLLVALALYAPASGLGTRLAECGRGPGGPGAGEVPVTAARPGGGGRARPRAARRSVTSARGSPGR